MVMGVFGDAPGWRNRHADGRPFRFRRTASDGGGAGRRPGVPAGAALTGLSGERPESRRLSVMYTVVRMIEC